MFNLLVEELKQHKGHVAYIANKEYDGISHYYISNGFPMLGGFDAAITRRLKDLTASIGLDCGHPVAYCKLVLRDDELIYMDAYFADIGERSIALGRFDFPKLTKDEDQE